MVSMGIMFCRWKVDMNNYVKNKEVSPPNKMGKVTKAQWEQFVAQRTTPQALALSEANQKLAKKNQYPHHLDSTGYASSIPECNRKIEELSVGSWLGQN